MINEAILMNGYGVYVWSAFLFTLMSFAILFTFIKLQLIKEEKNFKLKVNSLAPEKVEIARKQETYKEIFAYTSASEI